MKQIGNYTYNEKFCLGQGAFGKVYEGTSKTGKKVAIKRIDKQVIESDSYLRSSIESEIQILKKFNHPNIVYLEDMVLTSNNIYIVTEFCKNGDLRQYLRARKLNQQQTLKILSQILSGFMEIVKLDVVHRDLKPANILINENTFKICDFGFAKYLKQVGKMNKTCVGTPIYMSPQVLKSKPYTNKTDVWSLGILTFEMLFGRTPWQGNSEDNLYKNITAKPLQIPHCSNFTYNLLKGMLEVQEQNRWSWSKIFEYTNLLQVNPASTPQLKASEENREPNQVQNTTSPDHHFPQPSQGNLKSIRNPQFCYFALVQLHLNPIEAPSFEEFRSCLSCYALNQYSQLSSQNTQYGRLMALELEQMKSLDILPCKSTTSIQSIKALGTSILKEVQKESASTSKQVIRLLVQS